MNIVVNSQDLAQELRLLNKIIPSKTAVPILSHVLMRVDEAIHLYATDLEIGLLTVCPGTIFSPGEVALPAKRLLDMVEQFTDGNVTLIVDQSHVMITAGSFKSRLQVLPSDGFPVIPTVQGQSTTLDIETFQQLIQYTRYAVPDGQTKYILQGALLTLAGPLAATVATDGKRLALATMPRSDDLNTEVILPVKTLDVLTAYGDHGEVTLTVDERQMFFTINQRVLISRMLEGQFPKYDRIIPRDNDKKAIINRIELAASLRRVGLVSEQHQACYFLFDQNSLTLSSSSVDVGDASESLTIDYMSEPLKICCNWKHILDFLEVAQNQSITLALKDASAPMLLTDGENHLGVIILMRK